ncbi:MAG: hypothetical protein QOH27_6477 [Mycobacterium sp.]|nr:hypothetical protein [Mycobacterium sp.]
MTQWWHSGPPRLRLRRRLLASSAPVAAVLVVAVVKLASVGVAGDSAAADFADRDAGALRGDVAVLNLLNVVEPGKAYFAAGALAVLDGRLQDADTQFSEALARTDPEQSCPTRLNLALVREALGDKASAIADGNTAVNRYLSALTVVDAAPTGCFEDDTASRLNEKIDVARVVPPPPPPAPPPVAAPAPPPPPSQTGSVPRDQEAQLRLNPGAGDPLDRLRQILRDAAAAKG